MPLFQIPYSTINLAFFLRSNARIHAPAQLVAGNRLLSALEL
jgi:hypothetical protein